MTTHAALVGALMPTSHNMIIYSLAAGGKVSITALILAGMVPAALLMICMLVAAYLVAIRRGYPAGTFPGWTAVLWSMVAAIPGAAVACGGQRCRGPGHRLGSPGRVGPCRGHLRRRAAGPARPRLERAGQRCP